LPPPTDKNCIDPNFYLEIELAVLGTPRPALNKSFIVLACSLFAAYMPMALPLAVLPEYICTPGSGFQRRYGGGGHQRQFVVTIALRNYIGACIDRAGGRRGTLGGLFICIISSACFLPAHFFRSLPYSAFGILLLGLTCFGLALALTRFFQSGAWPPGGAAVNKISALIATAGLLTIWLAPAPLLGMMAPWGGYEAVFLPAYLCVRRPGLCADDNIFQAAGQGPSLFSAALW
jgi:hypothetical protein